MQQEQLEILKNMTGADFEFVRASQSTYGIKYFAHHCATDSEFNDIAGIFNARNFNRRVDDVFYTCLEQPDKTCTIAVFENRLDKLRMENTMRGRIKDKKELAPIGKINGNDVYLELMPTLDKQYSGLVARHQRGMAVVNINGMRLPFYVSSGLSGKENEYGIASGKWYPLQGISESGWLNKMSDMNKNPYPELDAVCELLEKKYPATQVKQDALDNKLPLIGQHDLLEFANIGFPEGTPFNERSQPLVYYKNSFVYLPVIIDAWQGAATDYFESTSGVLATQSQKILQKVRRLDLGFNIKLEGDGNLVWFEPIPSRLQSYKFAGYSRYCFTDDEIKNRLEELGIASNHIVTSNNKKGFGIPMSSIMDSFERNNSRKADAFQNGVKNVEQINPSSSSHHEPKAQDDFFNRMLKKIKSVIND